MGQFALPVAMLGIGIIGMWLIGPKKSSTAAASPMPKLNSSVRGTTMGVAFGSNKISSQVVWAKNYTATRQKASGKGKGGGSGGFGSAKGGGAAGQNFIYTWDMIFNFGMADVPMMIRRGWIGGDPIEDVGIAALTSGLSSAFLDLFPPSSIVNEQMAALSYTEAFVGPGYPTGDPSLETWTYFQAQEGVACAWPYTMWTGFEQLILGQTPSVPQLFFEWVPLDAGNHFTSNLDFIGLTASKVGGPDGNYGYNVDDAGVLYVVEPATSGGSQGFTVSRLDNSASTAITNTQWAADLASLGLYALANTDFAGAFSVPWTKYVYAWGCNSGTLHWCGLMYSVNTDGSLTLQGGWDWLMSNGFNTFHQPFAVSVMSNQEVATVVQALDGTVMLNICPAPGALIGGTYFDPTVATTTSHQIRITELGTSNIYPFLNIISDRGPLSTHPLSVGIISGVGICRVFFYLGKPEMSYQGSHAVGSGVNPYSHSIAPSFPDGAVVQVDFVPGTGPVYNFVGVNNQYFKLLDGTDAIPFDDEYFDQNGAPGTSSDAYIGFTQSSAGNVILIGRPCSNDTTFVGVRAFGISALGDSATQIAKFFGEIGDASQLGTTPTNPFAGRFNYYNNHVYFSGIVANGATETANAILGGPQGDAIDVTPAYIIYRILTNEAFGFATDSLFGFTVTADRIDTLSYEAAVTECENQGCFISVRYDNSTNVLQIIDDLLALYGGFLTETDGIISFGVVKDSDASVRTLDNDHFVVEQGDPPVTVTKAAIDDGYNKVVFHYLDRQLDYNQNEVIVSEEVDWDFNGPRVKTWDTQYTMSGSLAAQIATRALWANLYGRDGFEFKLGWKDADLRPGNVVTVVDSFDPTLSAGRRVRLIRRQATDKRGVFTWNAVQEYSYITNASGYYTSIASIDPGYGGLIDEASPPLFQTAYELPKEFQGTTPEVYFGYGMAAKAMGAQLHLSTDGAAFVLAQDVQPYPISGVLAAPLAARKKGYCDLGTEFYIFPTSGFNVASPVFVQDYALDDITAATRAVGGGVIVVGSEAMAMQDLTLLGQNHYRAKYNFRGWGGSPITSHSSGSNFHAHAAGIFTHDISEDDIGTTLYYKIAPYNFAGKIVDLASLSIGSYRVKGDFWLPREQPCSNVWVASAISWPGSTAFRNQYLGVVSGGCDVVLTWPLADNQEGYGAGGNGAAAFGHFTLADSVNWRVDVMSSNGVAVSSFSVSTSYFKYTLAQNSADFHVFGKDLIYKVTPFNVKGDGYVSDTRSLSLFW